MATLGGAEAMHMGSEIGSIEVGKRADVVVISTDSPCMVGSSNLAAALVLHASRSDVETVIVNGEIVKDNGKLLRVDWSELKNELVQNAKELEDRWKHVDWDSNTDDLIQAWQVGHKFE